MRVGMRRMRRTVMMEEEVITWVIGPAAACVECPVWGLALCEFLPIYPI